MADVDRCISCGAPVPEGRMVCPACAHGRTGHDPYASCQGCPRREIGCHARCAGYQERARLAELRREERGLQVQGRPEPPEGEMRRRIKRLKNDMARGKGGRGGT